MHNTDWLIISLPTCVPSCGDLSLIQTRSAQFWRDSAANTLTHTNRGSPGRNIAVSESLTNALDLEFEHDELQKETEYVSYLHLS